MLLAAAAAIVCATNIGALTRAAMNRSGTPEAEITLTERELPLVRTAESTATLVRLTWVQRFDPEGAWLTCPKLEEIGARCSLPHAGAAARWSGRQPARTAYVVLEYDGPAWEAYREAQLRRAPDATQQNPMARQNLEETIARSSRLVAIDVGRDADALRARYPDVHRYLIAKGRVAIYGSTGAAGPQPRISGTITDLTPAHINVPHPFSSTLIPRGPTAYITSKLFQPRYWITLRYGRLHEPWIVNAGDASNQ
jgi:hypothetical protein